MNYDGVKKMYEHMPKKLKYALSPIFIRLVVENATFKRTFLELNKFEHLSAAEQNQKQFKLLKDTLIYAYEHVPYYKKLFNQVNFDPFRMQKAEELKKLPLLTKDMAIEAKEQMYSDENINYFESLTGGSSGRSLKVLLDKDSIYKERAFINQYLAKFGFNPKKSRTLAIMGHNKGEDYYYSPLKNEMAVSPFRLFDESRFEMVWKAVEKFQPDIISGYPSGIYMFAQLMERYNKQRKFQLVDFFAENYTEEMKSYVEKIMQCRAVANYGHTERAVFATLYDKGYLFHKMYGYTEFLPTETEGEFQVVCTGFISRKMPLIRYVTDDVVRFTEGEYAYIQGHKTSEACLLSKTGTKIFKGALTLHVNAFNKVRQYQYVQYEQGKAFLDLVLIEPLSEKEKKEINSYLAVRCEGLLDVELRFVDQVQLTRRGKYNWAVSKINESSIAK